jgi:ThiF family
LTDSAAKVFEELEPYFQAVEALCAARGVRSVRLEDARKGYIGIQLQGATRKWDLYVDCKEVRLRLPHLSLGGSRSLLAHVGYDGTVCVDDGQGLSIDPDRHAEIVAYTVLAGYDLLEKSAADAAADMVEFFNELEGYWFGLPDSLRGRAAFEVDAKDRLIAAFENKKTKPPRWYFSEWDEPPPPEFDASKLAALRALYVHLHELPMPPVQPDKLGTNFIEDVRAKFSPEQRDLWSKLVGPSKNGPKRLALLVSVPRVAGGRALVGAVFGAARGVVDHKAALTPLTLRRHTASYMRERGGASLDLLEKHVAVLGCGAVGSVVADALAAAGIGKLTLVDHDDYSEDNVFRHLLDPVKSSLCCKFSDGMRTARLRPCAV